MHNKTCSEKVRQIMRQRVAHWSMTGTKNVRRYLPLYLQYAALLYLAQSSD